MYDRDYTFINQCSLNYVKIIVVQSRMRASTFKQTNHTISLHNKAMPESLVFSYAKILFLVSLLFVAVRD